jgi:Zn-dependent protease with chaperone function
MFGSEKIHVNPKVYGAADDIRETFHFAAAAATAGAAGYWAGFTTLGFVAAGTGALALLGNRYLDSFISRMFKHRSADLSSTPRLEKMIIKLSKRAHFDAIPELLDFDVDRDALKKADLISGSPAQFQRVVNAAAGGLRRQAVIVSEDLLRMTSSGEEKFLISHEFSHLIGGHTRLRLIAGWLQSTTMVTAMFGLGNVAATQGWTTAIVSIAGSIAITTYGRSFMPPPEEAYTREGELKPGARRKRMIIWGAQEALSIGALAAPNPIVVLPAVLLEHSFFWAANFVYKRHSRTHEFFADRIAVEFFGADPLDGISALRKIDAWMERDEPEVYRAHNLAYGPWYSRLGNKVESLFWTHPSMRRRYQQLTKIALAMGYDEQEIQNALTKPVDISGLPSRKLLIAEYDKERKSPEWQAKRDVAIAELLEEIRKQRKEDLSFIEMLEGVPRHHPGSRIRNTFALALRYVAIPVIKRLDKSMLNKHVRAAQRIGCDPAELERALNEPLGKNLRERPLLEKNIGLSTPQAK